MNRLLGYSLTSLGMLGFFFFLKYTGTAIPLKELWFVLSFFAIVAGAYFIIKYKLNKQNNQSRNSNSIRLAEIEQLKRTGNKVRVTLDNAEVKSRSYQQEIVNEDRPSQMAMLDALYDSNRNYKTKEISQAYIAFYRQYDGKTYKYISQAMQNADALKRYIDDRKGIDLYIDPSNPKNYYFDLPYT